MCDCPTNKRDGDKDVVEMVTLFRKCPKPYHPGKDMTRPSSCDLISDKNDWIPIDSSQSDLGYTICDQIKRLSSSSSYTSSSKTVPVLVEFKHLDNLNNHRRRVVSTSSSALENASVFEEKAKRNRAKLR